MWLVGSSCLCKLMTSLFSVVSFHWFVLLAHWSPRAPSPQPILFLAWPRSPVCLSIQQLMASVLQEEGEKMSYQPATSKKSSIPGSVWRGSSWLDYLSHWSKEEKNIQTGCIHSANSLYKAKTSKKCKRSLNTKPFQPLGPKYDHSS